MNIFAKKTAYDVYYTLHGGPILLHDTVKLGKVESIEAKVIETLAFRYDCQPTDINITMIT